MRHTSLVYDPKHEAALECHPCLECGAVIGELCKQMYNEPLVAPMRYWVHESRLHEPLLQAMRKAAAQE